MADCTSAAALSMSRLRLNWMATEVEPWALVALMESMPAIVENCLMSGGATAFAMVRGAAAGGGADHVLLGAGRRTWQGGRHVYRWELGTRERRHGEEQIRKYAACHHRDRHERRRNRVADAELRNVHRAALPSTPLCKSLALSPIGVLPSA